MFTLANNLLLCDNNSLNVLDWLNELWPNYATVQPLTPYTWTTQRSIALLLGAWRDYIAPGARSKFGAPIFEPEVFRKQMNCTEVIVTLLGLFGAPQSFSALIVIRHPGNCAPFPPSLRPWLLRAATRLNKSWYTALTRGMRQPRALGGAKFSVRPNFWATFSLFTWRISLWPNC